jgi:hypothetical protein
VQGAWLRAIFIPSSAANVFLRCFQDHGPFTTIYFESEVPRPSANRSVSTDTGHVPTQAELSRVAWSLVVTEYYDRDDSPGRAVASRGDEFLFGYVQACEDMIMNRRRLYCVEGTLGGPSLRDGWSYRATGFHNSNVRLDE